VNDRVIGLTLDEIRRIPLRVVVAGGHDKDRAIHAALEAGLISVLVTDAGTAARVLTAHRQEKRRVNGATRD
jgi:DNA-binding transcriptional regulator LsrR (DeoR family)